MTMEKEMSLRVNNLGAWCLLIFAAPLLIGVAWIDEATAQKVRVAMPAKSMTFLNFYVGDKLGIYKAEGLNVSLEVIKTEVGVATKPVVATTLPPFSSSIDLIAGLANM